MFRLPIFVVCALVVGAACKGHPPEQTEDKNPPVVAAPAEDFCKKAEVDGPLSWFADDFASALACAKQKKVPLVIDLWAPWCHTCLSMQTTVFQDPSFKDEQKRFVFAKLDTDRDANAAPLEKLAISAWPTFYVINSTDETVLARFVGAATVSQFHDMLDAGLRMTHTNKDEASQRQAAAERALAVQDLAKAETELTAALAAAKPAWLLRPNVLNSLVLTKLKREDYAGCVDLATKYIDEIGNSAVTSDFLTTAASCADKLTDLTAQKAYRQAAVKRWQRLLEESKVMSVDDRSDAMASMREAMDALGDKANAKKTAEAQRALLDDAAAKAPTPFAAMTYNWPRAEVYVYLGKPLDLVPALEKSAADLPKEYDPAARLGWLYFQAKKYDDAAKWTDKALALVYGPRKGRLLGLRAMIAAAQGDTASEKKYWQDAVTLYEGLPKGQAAPEALANAKEALAKAGTGSGAGSGSGSGSKQGSKPAHT
ncbi:MAG: thioredoxin family protein [Deltaproteobacteria bacterium]